MSTDFAAPPVAPAPKKKSRKWLWIAGAVVGAVALIAVGSASGKASVQPAATPASVTVTAAAPPAVTVTAEAPAPVTVTAPAAAPVTVTAAAPPAVTVTAEAAAPVTVTEPAPPAVTVAAPAAAPPAGSYSSSDPGAFSDCMADALALSDAGDYQGSLRKNAECARLIG